MDDRIAFAKADAELNAKYQRLMGHLPRDLKGGLVSTQRAWIVYRDTDVKIEYMEDINNFFRANKTRRMTYLTNKRIADIYDYLTGMGVDARRVEWPGEELERFLVCERDLNSMWKSKSRTHDQVVSQRKWLVFRDFEFKFFIKIKPILKLYPLSEEEFKSLVTNDRKVDIRDWK